MFRANVPSSLIELQLFKIEFWEQILLQIGDKNGVGILGGRRRDGHCSCEYCFVHLFNKHIELCEGNKFVQNTDCLQRVYNLVGLVRVGMSLYVTVGQDLINVIREEQTKCQGDSDKKGIALCCGIREMEEKGQFK